MSRKALTPGRGRGGDDQDRHFVDGGNLLGVNLGGEQVRSSATVSRNVSRVLVHGHGRHPCARGHPTKPMRSGALSTSRTSIVASGWMQPSTQKNAAWDGSPGTVHASRAVDRGEWSRADPRRRPRSRRRRRRAQHRPRSSVGFARSRATVVGPAAASAAKRIADFTCALAVGTS